MSAYADTSFLLSLVGQDRNTPLAQAHLTHATIAPRMPWTLFGALEFNNAGRALVFRGKLTATGLKSIQGRLAYSLTARILERTPLPVYLHFQQAEILSAAHTARHGARTLDLLHVAAARVLRAMEFLSFDTRQRQFAVQCGLRVLP